MVPEAFTRLRDLVRSHLKQISKSPRKRPEHAAVLVVLVACEALSKMLGRRRDDDVFATELMGSRGVPREVGRDLFNALRNGLAHEYTSYPIHVDGEEVWPIMAWGAGAERHLQVAGVVDGNRIVPLDEAADRSYLIVAVECLIADLNAAFDAIETELRADASLVAAVNRRARIFRTQRAPRPNGPALGVWRGFIAAHQWQTRED